MSKQLYKHLTLTNYEGINDKIKKEKKKGKPYRVSGRNNKPFAQRRG